MQVIKYPVSITLTKSKDMIYFSQLDIFHILEKALRRSGLPLYYTRGFNPHPKISLFSGLKLGQKGEIKGVFYFLERISADKFYAKFTPQLPSGLEIVNIQI